jgi:hypothetical protein
MAMTPNSSTLERFTCLVSFFARLQQESTFQGLQTSLSFSLVEEKISKDRRTEWSRRRHGVLFSINESTKRKIEPNFLFEVRTL